MTDQKNKKIPESDAKWEYPWNQVTQTLGGHEIHYNSTPNEESTRMVHPSGSYEENTKDGHQVKLVVNQKNSLVSQGASETIEGALDKLVAGGMRNVNLGGLQTEIAKHMSQAIHGQLLQVCKNALFSYTDNEHSEASTGGKTTSHNDGFKYDFSKETNISMSTASQILGASKELMVHAGGNADIFSQLKARMFSGGDMLVQTDSKMNTISKKDMKVASNSNITIQADTKITIKVGDNASITISDGLIELKATKINVTATGELNANGHPLKINGGGPTSTPTQWP